MAKLLLIASLVSTDVSTHAQARDNDWLTGMPAARQVVDAARGVSERDTAAQASVALQIMNAIVQNLSPQPFNEQTLSPEIKRKLDEYRKAREQVDSREEAKFAKQNCEGDGCEKYLYPRCQQQYAFSPDYYRVVLDRHFKPEWQRSQVPRLHGTLWKRAMQLPPGTPLSADFGAALPCTGAGQGTEVASPSMLDYLAEILGGHGGRESARAFIVGFSLPFLVSAGLIVLFLLLHLRQFARRVTLDAADAMQVKSSAPHTLDCITGIVLSPSKGIQTITRVSGGNQGVSSSSETVIHDQFFIRTMDGQEQDIKMRNVDIAVREGHLMSAIRCIPGGGGERPYLLLRNHTLRELIYFPYAAARMQGVRFRYLWLMLLTASGFIVYAGVLADVTEFSFNAFPLLFALFGVPLTILFLALGITLMLRKKSGLSRFRKEVDERLIPELDKRAAAINERMQG
jgi:hypothetical protein